MQDANDDLEEHQRESMQPRHLLDQPDHLVPAHPDPLRRRSSLHDLPQLFGVELDERFDKVAVDEPGRGLVALVLFERAVPAQQSPVRIDPIAQPSG